MDYFLTNKNNSSLKVRISDIFYIRTAAAKPHVLQLVTSNDIYEISGSLKDIEKKAGLSFTRCHKKYLVNLSCIKKIDKAKHQLIFINDSIQAIEYSRRKLKEIEKNWKE